MKKLLLISCILSFALTASAQRGVINNGSNLRINDNAYFIISGSNGHFVNKNDGKVELEGQLKLSGDWDNQNTSPDIWLNTSSGELIFNGTATQTIWNKTKFNNLTISNTEGVTLDDETEVDNLVINNDGLLYGGGQNLNIYGSWNSENGTFIPESNHVYFVGDADQEITSKTSQEFYNVTINNGNKLIFNNDMGITNLYVTSGVAESSGNTDIDTKLVYNGTELQEVGAEWPHLTNVNVFIENASAEGVVLNERKEIGVGKTVTVSGRINFGTDTLSGPGSFSALPGATVSTKATNGLNSNLQLVGDITLSTSANYAFEGDLEQQTGALLPTEVHDLIINNTAGKVSLSNSGLLKINGNLTATNGYLNVRPDAQVSVIGNTVLSENPGLVLKSDVSGTASFIDNGTITGTGNAIAERYLATGSPSGWNICPPLSNAHDSVFDNPAAGVWFYNSLLPGWQQVPHGPISSMKGYVTKYDIDKTIAFQGALNTGELYREDLVRTVTPNNFGWNLIGNPYPSGYDWDEAELTQLNSAYYIRNNQGNVVSYVNGVGVPWGTTSIIPAMQAFWAQVNINFTEGSVVFNNAGRVHSAIPFYKAPETRSMIRLKAINDSGENETVVYFDDNATASFNSALDACHFKSDNPADPNISTVNTNQDEFSIRAVHFDNTHLAVPVNFVSAQSGQHHIKAYDFDNIDPNITIHLEDAQLNVMHNLRITDTYTFSHNPGNTPNRFILHFNAQIFSSETPANASQNMDVYAYQNNIYISLPDATNDTYLLNVYNMLGQIVYSESLPGVATLKKIELQQAEGNYIVNIRSTSTNFNKKICIF